MGINEVYSFYVKLLEMLDLIVDDKGQIFMELDNAHMPIFINKIPMYLPTAENIKTMFDIVDGKSVKVKEIFNPLNENAFKGGNSSFLKLKAIIDIKLLSVFYYLSEALLVRASKSDVDETDMNVIKLQSLISRQKTTSKNKVDQKTIDDWSSILNNIKQKYINKKYIALLLTKGAKIDNITYNRVGVITFPLGEELYKLKGKDKTILDVSLRGKDVINFKTLYEFMFGSVDIINDGIQIGSLNKTAPSLHALLLVYDKVFNTLKPLLDTVKAFGLDEDTMSMMSLHPVPLDVINLSTFIDDLEPGARMIPSDTASAADTNNFGTQSVQATTKVNKGDFWDTMKNTNISAPRVAGTNQQVVVVETNNGYNQPSYLNQQQPNVINVPASSVVVTNPQQNQQGFNQQGFNQPVVVNHYNPNQQQSNGNDFWSTAKNKIASNPYNQNGYAY